MKRIIIAKSGGSITDAKKDLLFHSDDNTMKIFIDRKDTIGAGGTLAIAHGLTYTPMFMGFANDGTGKWYPVDGFAVASVYGVVDATNIGMQNSAGSSRTVRTFGFIDRLV